MAKQQVSEQGNMYPSVKHSPMIRVNNGVMLFRQLATQAAQSEYYLWDEPMTF